MKKLASINETIRLKIRRKYMEKTSHIRKKDLEVNDFSIISNNCWAGFIYQSYDLPYKTPTIGLFIMPSDYIKFIKDIRHYINEEIHFIKHKESKFYEELLELKKFGQYPIGVIDDIEIHFLHYSRAEEAELKWKRRCKRINFDNIVYKFNDQNGCTFQDAEEFKNMNFNNQIFFSNRWDLKKKNHIYIEENNENGISASREPFGKSKTFNVTKFLNDIGK